MATQLEQMAEDFSYIKEQIDAMKATLSKKQRVFLFFHLF